jgi:hypothetical protein
LRVTISAQKLGVKSRKREYGTNRNNGTHGKRGEFHIPDTS